MSRSGAKRNWLAGYRALEKVERMFANGTLVDVNIYICSKHMAK